MIPTHERAWAEAEANAYEGKHRSEQRASVSRYTGKHRQVTR